MQAGLNVLSFYSQQQQARQCVDLWMLYHIGYYPCYQLLISPLLQAIIPFDIGKVDRNNSCALCHYACQLCLSPRPVGRVQKWMSCAYSVNNQWAGTWGCLQCKHLLLPLWLVESVKRVASERWAGQVAGFSGAIYTNQCPCKFIGLWLAVCKLYYVLEANSQTIT